MWWHSEFGHLTWGVKMHLVHNRWNYDKAYEKNFRSRIQTWSNLASGWPRLLNGGNSTTDARTNRVPRALKADCRAGRAQQTHKKGYSSVDVGLTEKFLIIERLKQNYSIFKLRLIFGVHRSSYEQPKVIPAHEVQIRALVQEAYNASNGSAGARTIAGIFTSSGKSLSRYRARKIMKSSVWRTSNHQNISIGSSPENIVEVHNHLERCSKSSMSWWRHLYLDWESLGLPNGCHWLTLLKNLLVGLFAQ